MDGKRGTGPRADDAAITQTAGIALEQFHLAFLEVATAQLPLDRFALKGGANLRLFLGSLRRSVDMDFDYLGGTERASAFAERVDRIFASNALAVLLRARGIALASVRRPKQTDITRRWRFNLEAPGVQGVPSKIELSAGTDGGHAADYELAPIDAELARRLRARPVRLNHYVPTAAIGQKIGALRLRSETQPRDVFDLDHLFREFPEALASIVVPADHLRAAAERALALSYEEYASTVVPYLEEGIVDVLGGSQAWTDMQLRVVERLEWKGGRR